MPVELGPFLTRFQVVPGKEGATEVREDSTGYGRFVRLRKGRILRKYWLLLYSIEGLREELIDKS